MTQLRKLTLLFAAAALLAACHRPVEIGDYYHAHGVKGVVVSLDNTGSPALLLSLEEASNMDADSALLWCASQMEEGWSLPTKEQLDLVASHKGAINSSLSRRNLPEMMNLNTWYWSSTPCRDANCDTCPYSHVYAYGPDGNRCYFRENASPYYRVRAVYELSQE